jgi:hypothetical protein
MDQAIFRSQSLTDGAPGFRERSGETVTILTEVQEDDTAIASDDEVARLYRIRFDDGVETEAFEDELDVAEVSEAS